MKLGEVLEVLPGKYLPKEEYEESGKYIIYGSNSVMGRSSRPLYKGPLIVLARIGSNCGAIRYTARDCWVNNNAAGLRAKPPFSTRYLYYWLAQYDWGRIRQGSGQAFVSTAALLAEDVELPSPKAQRDVARLLGALDDKIELNRQMSQTLEKTAQAIFRSWFIDFDGHSDFVDSELGPIPRGWRAGTLGDLVDRVVERVEASPAKDDERYVALDDMPSKSIDLSTYRAGSEVNSSITRFRKGDILFGSMRPYFHKVGLAQFDGITRTTTFVLRPRDERYRTYALLAASTDEAVSYATASSVGTTIPYVKWDALSAWKLPIPEPAVLERLTELVGPMLARIACNGAEAQTLAELRDALLPKLISGEIRVPEAAEAIEEVAS